MSEAPDRIWACVSKNTKSGVVTLLGDATFPVSGWHEYVRVDRIEELEAKLAKAVDEVLEILDDEGWLGKSRERIELLKTGDKT